MYEIRFYQVTANIFGSLKTFPGMYRIPEPSDASNIKFWYSSEGTSAIRYGWKLVALTRIIIPHEKLNSNLTFKAKIKKASRRQLKCRSKLTVVVVNGGQLSPKWCLQSFGNKIGRTLLKLILQYIEVIIYGYIL